jgi:hypothetical protein
MSPLPYQGDRLLAIKWKKASGLLEPMTGGKGGKHCCKVATTLKERGKQPIYAIPANLPRHTGSFYNPFTPIF